MARSTLGEVWRATLDYLGLGPESQYDKRPPIRRGNVVRLRRSFEARIRGIGLIEFLTFFMCFPIAPALIRGTDWLHLVAGIPDHPVRAVLFGLACALVAAVRIAVAKEYVESDGEWLRWRSLFLTRRCRLDEVESFGRRKIWLFPWREDALELRFIDGRRRWLRPTIWCLANCDEWLTELRGPAQLELFDQDA